METTNVTIRMDRELKKKADELFKELGLNMSTAMGIFLRQAVREQGIPFAISKRTPNEETLEAMKEIDDMINKRIPAKRYNTVQELFEELEA